MPMNHDLPCFLRLRVVCRACLSVILHWRLRELLWPRQSTDIMFVCITEIFLSRIEQTPWAETLVMIKIKVARNPQPPFAFFYSEQSMCYNFRCLRRLRRRAIRKRRRRIQIDTKIVWCALRIGRIRSWRIAATWSCVRSVRTRWLRYVRNRVDKMRLFKFRSKAWYIWHKCFLGYIHGRWKLSTKNLCVIESAMIEHTWIRITWCYCRTESLSVRSVMWRLLRSAEISSGSTRRHPICFVVFLFVVLHIMVDFLTQVVAFCYLLSFRYAYVFIQSLWFCFFVIKQLVEMIVLFEMFNKLNVLVMYYLDSVENNRKKNLA